MVRIFFQVRFLSICRPESQGGDHHHAPFPPIKPGDVCLVSLTLQEKCHANYDENGIDIFLGKQQQNKYKVHACTQRLCKVDKEREVLPSREGQCHRWLCGKNSCRLRGLRDPPLRP